ncbi:MAG: glycosyltransferase family 2 protein [Bacteroidetes bacterium]|nr:glycosyltransferase family 2 protein [Bacteroidota bacterium]
MSLISVCFAVYQNEGSLTILYDDILKQLEGNFPKYNFEFIFVNDGSKDNSLKELTELKKRTGDQRIRIVSFSRNFGQMAAILAGWKYATGDAVINMAADLQDPPIQCVEMIKEWEAGNEIVVSYRKAHGTSRINKLTSHLFYKMLLPNVPPGGFDFVLLDKKPMNIINNLKERNRFYQYDILWAGFKVKFIPYEKLTRTIGKSQYNLIKRFGNFMVAFISVSYFPLRLMSILGFLFSIAGFLYSLSILHAYFYNGTPFTGWAPIMILLLIIGGLLMLMLGVLGEYIWRIYDEVKQRPVYIVDKEL